MAKQPSSPAAACCDDYLASSRRGFLRGALGVTGAAALGVTYGDVFAETAFAASGTAENVLVVLSMRGAADGLSLVVPHGDPAYYAARPRISVPRASLLAPDAFFGLHPSLNPLLPLWRDGKMAAVHAAGQRVTTRSHFVAMEEVEDSDPGSSARVGWLNRLIGLNNYSTPLEAIQFGGGTPPTQLAGPALSLTTQNVDSLRLAGPGDPEGDRGRRRSLATNWGRSAGPLGAGARSAMTVADQFAPVRNSPSKPANGASYPGGDLASALAATARTIRADVGAEVITVDHGSWDHHQWIGTPGNGNLQRMADEFASATAAFFKDLGPLASKVTLVTISEFGRRVKENASQGLDHGHGNVMFLMGAGVKGGYYGNWPGIQNTADADLLVTTDYRSVLSEVIRTRFPTRSTATVFPGFAPAAVGVMRVG